MQMLRPSPLHRAPDGNRPHAWIAQLFSAQAVARGGVIRRWVRDVEREVGRVTLEDEVRRRGYHMVECGGQLIIICNAGQMRVIC